MSATFTYMSGQEGGRDGERGQGAGRKGLCCLPVLGAGGDVIKAGLAGLAGLGGGRVFKL